MSVSSGTKKKRKMLASAELTERKKLKNATEKIERENHLIGIICIMLPTPLIMKNSRGKIVMKGS